MPAESSAAASSDGEGPEQSQAESQLEPPLSPMAISPAPSGAAAARAARAGADAMAGGVDAAADGSDTAGGGADSPVDGAGSLPRFTGGDTGIPWGTNGVWTEPFTEAAARDTLRRLELHWHRLDIRAAAAGDDADVGDGDEDASGGEGEGGGAAVAVQASFEDADAPTGESPRRTNGVCSHTACSAVSFCIVEHLQLVRSHYRDRIDQFRIKVGVLSMPMG